MNKTERKMKAEQRKAQIARLAELEAKHQQDAADLNAKIAAGAKYILRTAFGELQVRRASVSSVTGPTIYTDGNGGFGMSFCAYVSDCIRVD